MRYLVMLAMTLALLVLASLEPLIAGVAPQSTVHIKISDLPLSDAHSWPKLHRRISRAAHAACDTANETLDPNAWRIQNACRRQLTDAALAMVAARQNIRAAAR